MKKVLFFILFFVLASPAMATVYYAQADANIDTATLWDTVPGGGGTDLVWGNLQAGDILYANNHAVVVNVNVTCAKISTQAGPAPGTAGGSFTVSTTGITVQAAIEAGAVPGLVITGAGVETTIGSSGTPVAITGGSAAAANGVSDGHTTAGKNTTVYATTIQGGTNGTARGYAFTGATGNVNITATSATGVNGAGVYTGSAGTMTFNGDCIGSDTATSVPGCLSALGIITVTGSIKAGTKETGATGYIYWAPSATTKYLQYKTTGAADLEARSPAAADVRSGTTYGTATGSMAAGGGGAWGF